MEVGRKIIVI